MGDAAAHYDALQRVPRSERLASDASGVRLFNNWLKSALISLCLREVRAASSPHTELRVLDLACGAGGDLFKFARERGVSEYVGADASLRALELARERWAGARDRGTLLSAAFEHVDLREARPADPAFRGPFHLVSCQFAFHYACGSEDHASNWLARAAESMGPGSRAAFTWPCSRTVRALVAASDARGRGPVQGVRAAPCGAWPAEADPAGFGQAYRFTLAGCVDECVEYLVPEDRVAALARAQGLELAARWPATQLFADLGADPHLGAALMRRMGLVRSDGSLNMEAHHWAAVQLYVAAVFVKV